MYRTRWMQGILWTGLVWFLLGIAWAPTNKIYQQGLVLLLWVPVLIATWSARRVLWDVGRVNPLLCGTLLLFLLWAAASMIWSTAEAPLRELKRILYVVLFLLVFPLIQAARPEVIARAFRLACIGLSLAALFSFYVFYVEPLRDVGVRISGIGQLDHPILGSYVMGLAIVWGLQFIPRSVAGRVCWAGLLSLPIIFIVLGQSRGAAIALLICTCSMPLWSAGRRSWFIAGLMALLAIIGFIVFEPLVMARGVSYRPEIFVESLKMISQHPWLGLGINANYLVVTESYPHGFAHSHNGFTHAAIELGIPGLLLLTGVWFFAAVLAWRERSSLEGRLLLSTMLVAGAALQFDAASIWGSPRAEWFLVWLPIGLALALLTKAVGVKMPVNSEQRANDE